MTKHRSSPKGELPEGWFCEGQTDLLDLVQQVQTASTDPPEPPEETGDTHG